MRNLTPRANFVMECAESVRAQEGVKYLELKHIEKGLKMAKKKIKYGTEVRASEM